MDIWNEKQNFTEPPSSDEDQTVVNGDIKSLGNAVETSSIDEKNSKVPTKMPRSNGKSQITPHPIPQNNVLKLPKDSSPRPCSAFLFDPILQNKLCS